MDLQFITCLTEEQLVELLNYCLAKKEHDNNPVRQVNVLIEPDRCDEFGNRQIYVNAYNGCFHKGSYNIQDFTMSKAFLGSSKGEYNKELREYMASLFGEEYLEALKVYYAISAENEINRIKSVLGQSRS